jgi:sulfatase modifying factor 1
MSCSSILDDAGPDATRPFSSCDGLAAICGSAANDNCCSTATAIPGGMFFRSYDVATDGMNNNTGYPATVSDFRLDKYEVTVGRFRRFLTAGMGTQANPPPIGAGARTLNGTGGLGGWDANWNSKLSVDTVALRANVKCNATQQTWTDAVGANENKPMNCVTWYEAMAFCIWDGGHLPTEAEWNFAAAGGGEARAYPWSSPPGSTTIDCSYANYNINSPAGTYCVNGGGTNRVGSESPKGDGKWGQADLAGNVFEWVLDWYASPYPNPCSNCANLTPASERVIRGASWNIVSYVRAAYRAYTAPTFRGIDLGVRCARAP